MSRLAGFVLLSSVLAACGESKPVDAGKKLFASQGCLACHMPGGTGSMMGPPLRGLAANWSRDKLASYFADPEAFAEKDPRLKALKSRFKTPMAPIKANAEQRALIADYVLSL